ncbi:assimilatory sulfite reductase (NADPH) hemoprotein subunit [Kurthia huakuii]|uniref:assimilatory sulfite reductase (NADPH) hemoprotein subunit n=1 Tax=Kurthia huakuii TaxID=1421019 RepID=UPI000497AFC6|nr:assimilatory sulfite reductase (NADPH) hemoprotein subunit [Kurthia huakuii]MBM7698089.1 sulfite reductase (NADPH) hemoprotein beta-component [Kurthia huakuii]
MSKKVEAPQGKPSANEIFKDESNFLRGTIEQSFKEPLSGKIPEMDTQLIKFHGSYMQDNRDERLTRQKKKLEPSYQFMVRVRTPGGTATPEQWLMMDEAANTIGNGTLKVTTRQAFQIHGIVKWNVKTFMQKMDSVLLDSLAACGDVNRNVMNGVNPHQSATHAEIYDYAAQISEHLLPRTQAYHEIWLDGEKVAGTPDIEPIYGEHYLPRKFKIGLAVPPSNDVDVYSQDIGLIAIVEGGELQGFNIAVGGGMGMTHGEPDTYPQLARTIGYVAKEKIVDACEKILTIQRDYGNRTNRKNARFKYTIDRVGIEWFKEELDRRLGYNVEPTREAIFKSRGDDYGWVKGTDGNWHFTLFIENGRIKDVDGYPLMTGIREIAKVHTGEFRMTANQNLMIANVTPQKKRVIQKLIEQYNLTDGKHYSAIRRNSIACVSLPTCGLAMAEAERYLPGLITKIDAIIDEAGLHEEEIVIRMSGCPNGCSRAAMAEIGFIGKGPGRYNMYLGASFIGDRLSKMYLENIDEQRILAELTTLINRYATEREEGEHFGDFVVRIGVVTATTDGTNFHANTPAHV